MLVVGYWGMHLGGNQLEWQLESEMNSLPGHAEKMIRETSWNTKYSEVLGYSDLEVPGTAF